MIKPKKKNLFAYFKSEAFNTARVNLCAMYILLSKVNELKEDTDRDLQGFNGLFIGELKHASNEALKAFDNYVKAYEAHIGSDGSDLCDATIDVTKEIDEAIENNSYYLKMAHKALRKAIDEATEKYVNDKEQLEKEAKADFEICGEEERVKALNATLQIARNRQDELKGDVLKGVEIGFNTAINYINRIYLTA